MDEEKRYPKGHWLGIGIALGLPLGIPFGIAIGNLALGPALGLPIGVAIGTALEAKYNPNPRPHTPEEQKRVKLFTIAGTITFLLGVVAFFMV